MSAGRTLLQLVGAVQTALSANLQPDGPADHESLAELCGLMDCAEERAAVAQAQQDETDAELWRFLLRTIPDGVPENIVMRRLMQEFNEDQSDDLAVAFTEHVKQGLAQFKASI